ncbi:FemAB family protein [Maribacter sedimenticola]|uniref:FemAB family protein n=1 Tax=Maribacter sedimenticola TaxID=228956 RepID=A0ABY1SKF1_9FLAO|nr:GNAT family N-acetyltransferase [Maribacter sedimenticola]SNR66889.1 FemAB family protein [Maribacter sedimenticola]
MIEIITDGKEWKKRLMKFDFYDFYHTFDYHHLSKKDRETPLLMVYSQDEINIAIPFLKREIEGTPYFDLTSVYGYAGPIYNNLPENFDNTIFSNELKDYLIRNKIISVFSRLNPYFNQQSLILNNLGETPISGKVVNIDLTKSIEEQRTQYGKSTKNRTNKCRRIATVKEVTSQEDLETYIDIYYENMDRLGAKDSYYFSKEYFFNFLKSKDFKTRVLLVIENESGKAMAGSMFVETNTIVQFHLSGTRTKFLNWAPANLFLDEMRLLATAEGYQIFNLGGGLGGQEDSLFNFKASFSKDHRDFRLWKYIVNNTAYSELSKDKEGDFFPLYRKL